MMGLESRGEPLWGRSGVTGRSSVEPDRAITANGKELTTSGRPIDLQILPGFQSFFQQFSETSLNAYAINPSSVRTPSTRLDGAWKSSNQGFVTHRLGLRGGEIP